MLKSIVTSANDANLEQVKAAGFEAVEFATSEEGELGLDSTAADVEAVRDRVAGHGLKIASLLTGLNWQYPLTDNDAEVREKGKAGIRKAIEIATQIGTDAILVVPGVVNDDVAYDVAHRRVLEGLEELLPIAEKAQVAICLENVWNKLFLSPLEFAAVIDHFDSEYIKAYFDVGNVLAIGFPEQWIDILGKRIKRIHLKDWKRSIGNIEGFVGLLEGDVNWPVVMESLSKIGYDGPLTAEMGGYKHHSNVMYHHTSLAIDYLLGRK